MNSIFYREAQLIRFEEIKRATKYFQRDLIIGEGGFGTVYKGWIDERTLTASKPGSGMSVAIKKWNRNNLPFVEWDQRCLQGREEWMEYNAKLSDFGLARDGPRGNVTHVSTRVMGRAGYAAPELVATGHLTAKCDVYSFGVVLLELLCGLRAFDRNRVRWQHDLVEWAKPFLGKKTVANYGRKIRGPIPSSTSIFCCNPCFPVPELRAKTKTTYGRGISCTRSAISSNKLYMC